MRTLRRAVLSTLFVLSLSVFGAALPPGNWHEPVRVALQRMIDRHVNDPNAYAVFDFDNTCAIGDCEHAVLGYIIDNLAFAFSPDELPGIFLEGMPDPDRPLEPGKERATARNVVMDCADLYRELLDVQSRRSIGEARRTDAFAAFAAKMRFLRKRISRTFGSGFGYQWSKRFYCRMTPARFRDTMHAALDAAVADGRFRRCVWRTPAARAGRSGCVEVPMFLGFSVPQEVKDARLDALMSLQKEISLDFNRSRVGTVERVLVDAWSDGILVCRSRYESPDVDGEILVRYPSGAPVGSFVNVRIIGADEYDLIAEMVE